MHNGDKTMEYLLPLLLLSLKPIRGRRSVYRPENLSKKIKIQKQAFFTIFWPGKTYGSWDFGKKNENENEGTVFELEQFEGEKSAKIWKNWGGQKKFRTPASQKRL